MTLPVLARLIRIAPDETESSVEASVDSGSGKVAVDPQDRGSRNPIAQYVLYEDEYFRVEDRMGQLFLDTEDLGEFRAAVVG